jgi:dTDP-glucose 4,6-dehydratase
VNVPTAICVTGVAGFVGVNLAETLAGAGRRIVGIDVGDRLGRIESARPPLDQFVTADISRDASALDGHDLIIHLAALAHVDYSVRHPAAVLGNNVSSTVAVLEAARRTGARVVLASSVEVYGGDELVDYDEGDRLDPLSPYAASKVSTEALAETYRAEHGLDVVCLRFTNMFGPWQAPDRVIPRVLEQRRRGARSSATDGRIRDFLHVSDGVAAVRLAATTALEHPVYNITTGRGVEVRRIVESLRHGETGMVDVVRGDSGRGARLVASSARFSRETGWAPSVELGPALEVLRDWHDRHGDWSQRFASLVLAPTGSPDSLSDEVFAFASTEVGQTPRANPRPSE